MGGIGRSAGGVVLLVAGCTFSSFSGGGGAGADSLGTTGAGGTTLPWTGEATSIESADGVTDGIANPTATTGDSSTTADGTATEGDTSGACDPPASPGCPCIDDKDCVLGTECVDDICDSPNCGNDVLDPFEICDDGNRINDDGCDNDCAPSGGVAQVVAGLEHTCARTHLGEVKCWGQGAAGRLGYASTADIGLDDTPADFGFVELGVGAGGRAVDLCAGDAFSCAALEDGDLRCWGDGAAGRLGTGATTDIGDTETPASINPVEIGGFVVAVSCGTAHACALLQTGEVRCWGTHGSGRLGSLVVANVGDNEFPNALPVVQAGGAVVQVAAGGEHTCALLDTGVVRCWGEATLGRLGNGDDVEDIGDDEPPDTGANFVALGGLAVELAVGFAHSCARLDDGDVKCWGDNAVGQLGYGHFDDIGDDETLDSVVPLPLPGPAARVFTGNMHTCVVLQDTAELLCWGAGGVGRLGYGNEDDLSEAPAIPVNLGEGVQALNGAGGDTHTCMRVLGGALMCFGAVAFGRLGYGPLGVGNVGDDEDPFVAGFVPFD